MNESVLKTTSFSPQVVHCTCTLKQRAATLDVGHSLGGILSPGCEDTED